MKLGLLGIMAFLVVSTMRQMKDTIGQLSMTILNMRRGTPSITQRELEYLSKTVPSTLTGSLVLVLIVLVLLSSLALFEWWDQTNHLENLEPIVQDNFIHSVNMLDEAGIERITLINCVGLEDGC